MIKRKKVIWVMIPILTILCMFSIAVSDWISLETGLLTDKGEPLLQTVDGMEMIGFNVVVTNESGNDIEGDVRIIVEPLGGTADPVNPDGTTDTDGQDPHVYYELKTAQEDYFEAGESVSISMLFSAVYDSGGQLVTPEFDLKPELNDASIENGVFRKKISKTPELFSGESAIDVMSRYVPARDTKGQRLYKTKETGKFIPCQGPCPENDWATGVITQVKPIVVTYVQAVESTEFNSVPEYDADENGQQDGWRKAHDIYVAVSYDDGATWKRSNVSRTAAKSSYLLNNGVAYPGDSEKADLVVNGENVLITWIDKYCRSGNPWEMEEDWVDQYNIMGPQRSVDYEDVKGDDEPRPDLGVRPFSCVWAARGVLDLEPDSPGFGTITWYKGEQLSTGRRDAYQNFTAGIEPDGSGPGGFAVTWQEDPKGLKTGKGRGPGAGMSGACVNHKTDIWYTHIAYGDNFVAVDPEDQTSAGSGDAYPTATGDQGGYTPHVCLCGYIYDPYAEDPENPVKFVELPEGWTCPVCGRGTADFEKTTKPHPLHHFSTPVPVTDNAVCKQRTPTPVWGHIHDPGIDCDYYYEGGTNKEPIYWDDLPDDWECPKCGNLKTTFQEEPVLIKYRHEGAPYCHRFEENPRVDGDGNYVPPGTDPYLDAYYTLDGKWVDADGNEVSGVPEYQDDGTVSMGGTMVTWTGEPLDGNTGASRANLSLVNWNGSTLAVIAYEETKGIGVGGDKEEAAMEQAAPIPLVVLDDGTLLGGFTNDDCRSCHYDYVVPRDRVIPVGDPGTCNDKGGIWKEELEAYWPYDGYPYITGEGEPPDEFLNDLSVLVQCVKFEGGKGMYPRDWARTDSNAYYALPEHLPGWHSKPLDCAGCHLPFGTKVLDDDNDQDEVTKFRHGKNIFYHSFILDQPDNVSHGDMINLPNQYDWIAPGSYDRHENARRVRVVPNPMYEPSTDENADRDNRADITLGLLYKQGKDGQGAPADAFLRLFRDGFDIENLQEGALNLSGSTPYIFQDPDDAGSDDGSGIYGAGDGSGDLIGNHKTPKIDRFYWTDSNLEDPSGWWLRDENEERLWDNETPLLRANPFENVFSTRLAIRGDFLAVGFAHSANWAAAKKAKEHYDFYIRTSSDGGSTWSLPENASRIKNHEESVSDCRIMLPPPTTLPPGAGEEDLSSLVSEGIVPEEDIYDENIFFVAIGTKENIAQPSPNETELEEEEVFLDVFYSRTTDKGKTFSSEQKENPKYVEGALPYIDNITGLATNQALDGNGVQNMNNPTFSAFIQEFDWLAKGPALQGDVQIRTNPSGTRILGSWEQELPLDEEAGQTHFQGTDVWFRRVDYARVQGDLDYDQDIDSGDFTLFRTALGTCRGAAGYASGYDFNHDGCIDYTDYRLFYLYMREMQ